MTTVNDELAAMRKVVAALDSLDEAARGRVLEWLVARYDPIENEPEGTPE